MHSTSGNRIIRSFRLKVILFCVVSIGTFTTLWSSYYRITDGNSISLNPTAFNIQSLFSRLDAKKRSEDKPEPNRGNDLPRLPIPTSKPNHLEQESKSKKKSVLNIIRHDHLTPPSVIPYNLTNSRRGPENANTLPTVIEVLGNITNGVFIEAGAWDGEEASNSILLELKGWKGILVECNPHILPKLMNTNRKAWIADVCLSTSGKAGSVKLYSSPEWSQSAQIDKQLSLDEMKMHGLTWLKNKTWAEYERPSFTLQSIIAAVREFKEIDFLSLDVQGAEIGILENYPFELFPIKMILAEVQTFNAQQRQNLTNFMKSNGYNLHKQFGVDYAFVLNSVLAKNSSLSVLDSIRAQHLTKPSTKPYSFPSEINYANAFTKLVLDVLGNKTEGVFIEAGAYDGVVGSSTLHLELMGWKGLLVECNPQVIQILKSKNRKAWIADVCLSTTGKAGSVKLYSPSESQKAEGQQLSVDEMKRLGIDWTKNKTWTEYEAPTYSLQSILAAIGEFEEIDFLRLDVQGAEIEILKKYPFELFPIKVMIVEVSTFNSTVRDDLTDFMTATGYKLYKNYGNNKDYAFVLSHLV